MPGKRKWVSEVNTDATHPEAGLFAKDAETIAAGMARKSVSPKGLGSGVRMIQYFINRAGKSLPVKRRAEFEKAKRLLQEKQSRVESSPKHAVKE